MKTFLIIIAVLLVLSIISTLIKMHIFKVLQIRSRKIFYYFGNKLILLNYNKNDLYTGVMFGRRVDTSTYLGFKMDYMEPLISGKYEVIDDDSGITGLSYLFIIPKLFYELVLKHIGPDYSIDDLIEVGSMYFKFNKESHDIEFYIGKYMLGNKFSLGSYIKLKHIVNYIYKMISMKKDYIDILLVVPEVLDECNELIKGSQEKESKNDE